MKLKRKALCVALASAAFVMAHSAYAQQAATEAKTEAEQQQDAKKDEAQKLDSVTVTGIRRGIESAINLKLESSSIIEAISAEDIGKLPDSSIAESLARLPGLSAQRVAGRSSTIAIRGLAADFSTTLLNGREQVSSGDNRGVEFEQYPSELLNSVVVYKSADANLVAQGISGTVDLQTVRPLSFPDRVVSLNARLDKNSLGELNADSDDMGSRISASYIDQFADNTVGLALGFARLDSPGQAERWNAWGYPTQNVAGQNNVFVLGGSESYTSSTDNVRTGIIGIVEWQPNDRYSGALDVYYSDFERIETTRGLQTGLGWSGGTLSNPVVDNGLLVGGRWTGVRPVLRNDRNKREDGVFAIGLKNEFVFDDSWTGLLDLSMSRADRDESILETYAGTTGQTDTVDVLINRRTGLPDLNFRLNYADPSIIRLTDPGGWGQDGYVKYPEFEDELRSVRAGLTRSLESEWFSGVDFGLNYSKREKSRAVAEAFLDLPGRTPTAIPGDILVDPVDVSFTGIPGVISYDIQRAFGLYRPRTNINQDILNKDWNVEESVTLGYAKLNIDGYVGDLPLRGNIGLQYVGADQESQGFSVPGGAANVAAPFTDGTDYSDVLPSLNLALTLENDQLLRFGAGKQLSRPRMDQMRANSNISIDRTRGQYTGDGGNPLLEPWRATNYDLSYEKYFGGNRGYISLAAFHKDLRTYIYSQTVDFDFSVFDLSNLSPPRPPTTIGRFTRPANGEGGSLNGWEFAASVPFDMFSEALEGFGALASYADTRSSIKPLGPGTSQPLPGLSRYVSNITAYYEQSGFSTRISRRTRSSFIGEVQGFGADRETRYIRGEQVVDFQISYEFQDGSTLDGATLLLQVNNVTNEPYQEFFRDPGTPDRPRSYNEYGRTILFGVTYRFD